MAAGQSNRRSELRAAFDERPPPAGVYVIRHRASGKALIGSSLNAQGFLNRLQFSLTQGMLKTCAALQADWDRDGAAAFTFEVVDLLPPAKEPGGDPREELKVLEDLWRDRLRPDGAPGYELAPA